MSITRRSILGMIGGAPMAKLINQPKALHTNAKPNDTCVECGTEPLPQFPLMVVTRKVTGSGNYDHAVQLIANSDVLHQFDPTITDDEIKNLAYRDATGKLGNGTEYKLVTSAIIGTEYDGSFYFWAIKGQSGESMQVNF
jgi:hypothetical protein